MKIDKGEISSTQLVFLVTGFLQGAHLLIAFASGITKHDTWMAVLAAIAVSIPLVLVYMSIAQKFPGKTLMQINDTVYGPFLGKIISLCYIWYFLLLASLNLRTVGNFVRTYVMPETPLAAIIIMLVFICAWAVRKGIEVIARCSFIFVAISATLVLTVTVLLIKDMDFTNLLPVFDIPPEKFIQGAHIIAAIPFCQIVTFIMIVPYLNKVKQAKKSALLGVLFGGGQLLIIVARDAAVLGITATIMASPSFQATRAIDIAGILTRLDILVGIVLLITLFLRVSIFYYATVTGLAQLLKLRSYLQLVFPFGVIIISLAAMAYDSITEQVNFTSTVWPLYSLPFEVFIPIVTLIVIKIRRLPRRQGVECR